MENIGEDYKITFVAKDFETFIKGLLSEEHFDCKWHYEDIDKGGELWRQKNLYNYFIKRRVIY